MSLLNKIFGSYKDEKYSLSEAENTELKDGLAGLVNAARHSGSNSEETKKYFRETLAGYQSEGVRDYFRILSATLLYFQESVERDVQKS